MENVSKVWRGKCVVTGMLYKAGLIKYYSTNPLILLVATSHQIILNMLNNCYQALMEKINERYRNDTMMTNVLFYKVTVINQVSWVTVVKARYN